MSKTPNPKAALVLLGEDHSGRDEMNLAGHPFALLQLPRDGHTVNEIFYEWPRQLPNGKTVIASWRVTGDPLLNLPGPTDELLFLILMQLTREAADENEGIWPQTVHFSRADLIRRLGWHRKGTSFGLLADCFTRLNAVNVTACHAFWDARAKAPMNTVGFHILANFGIIAEPKRKTSETLPLSWFKWDEVLYNSFLAGNVRSLALDFTLSLQAPTARRLFRFLDSMRNQTKPPRSEFSIGLLKLRDRLAMTVYKHNSKTKQVLAPAIAELIETGYLADVSWEKTKEGAELAVFAFGNAKMVLDMAQPAKAPQNALKRETEALAPQIPTGESALERAHRIYAIYAALPAPTRAALLDQAHRGVVPIFWDRVDNPDSPMSGALWDLVETRENSDSLNS